MKSIVLKLFVILALVSIVTVQVAHLFLNTDEETELVEKESEKDAEKEGKEDLKEGLDSKYLLPFATQFIAIDLKHQTLFPKKNQNYLYLPLCAMSHLEISVQPPDFV